MRLFFLLAALSAALLTHAQPSCSQGICLTTTCVVGTVGTCGSECVCAAAGPGPRGFCVSE